MVSTQSFSHHPSYTAFLPPVTAWAISPGEKHLSPHVKWSWLGQTPLFGFLWFFSLSKLLAAKGKQSAGSVCRHSLRKSPSPPPAGSAHTSAAWETTNTTLVISSVLPAAEGLHKKNPWTSDCFLKCLSPQIFQQTHAGSAPARPVKSCLLTCPATFTISSHVWLHTLTFLTPPAWHTSCLVQTIFLKPSACTTVVWIQGGREGLAASFVINTLGYGGIQKSMDQGLCDTVGLKKRAFAPGNSQQVSQETTCVWRMGRKRQWWR